MTDGAAAFLRLNDDAPQEVVFEGTVIPLRLRLARDAAARGTLIVLFHGAFRRDTGPFPVYQGFLPIDAPQLAIADSGMLHDPDLATSWYLGREGQNLPQRLSRFVAEVMARIGAMRVIFVGGSSGGFAALLHARLAGAQALAVAACPQTNLSTYWNQRAVARFRASCFPGIDTLPALAAQLPMDMGVLYRDGFANAAVVVQSAGDRDHIAGQTSGFLQALTSAHLERVVVHVDYFGVKGHSGSVPAMAYVPWVALAVAQADWSADALLDARWRSRAPEKPPARQDAPRPRVHADADLRLADRLRDALLLS